MLISITNHKGGTGKTTTALNLASGLKKCGKKILLVDLDPQANLTYSLGIHNVSCDVVDVLLKKVRLQEGLHEADGLHVLPSSIRFYGKEQEFAGVSEKADHTVLRDALLPVSASYDFILIDCPPSFSVFTVNALVASDYALVPTLLDVLSLQGIEQVLTFLSRIMESLNPELKLLGVVGVNVDERRQLTYEVLEFIRDNYDVYIFNNYIRANVKAAEAPSFAQSVIDYAPESNSAKDYLAFSRELLRAVENIPEPSTKS